MFNNAAQNARLSRKSAQGGPHWLMGANEITCIRLLWHQITFEIEKRLGELSYGVHNWERLVIWCEEVTTSVAAWLSVREYSSAKWVRKTTAFLHDTMQSAINLPTFRGNALPPSSKQKRAAELSSKIMQISARLHGVIFRRSTASVKQLNATQKRYDLEARSF